MPYNKAQKSIEDSAKKRDTWEDLPADGKIYKANS